MMAISGKKCKICGKPLRLGGDIGKTCEEHQGEIGKYYINKSGQPNLDQYVSLKELCDLTEKLGKSRGWMVKLTGGDGGCKPPHSPEFTIYVFSEAHPSKKYCIRKAIDSVHEFAKIM